MILFANQGAPKNRREPMTLEMMLLIVASVLFLAAAVMTIETIVSI